jgi:phospholipid/cholesterol/gamma-HCH transport system substrate-binding protein
VWVKFPAVGGLRQGNVVRISGLEVGQVKAMFLTPDGVLARLRLQMPEERVDIHQGYRIRIKAFSPLGGKYVDLDRGNLAAPKLERPGFEPEKPLRGEIESELISEAADMVQELRKPLVEAAQNIAEATKKLNTHEGTLGKFINDPAVYDNIRLASAELAETAAKINVVVGRIEGAEGSLGKLIKDPALYDNATSTLAKLDEMLGSLREQGRTVGTTGASPVARLLYDKEMGADLSGAIAEVRLLLQRANAGEGTLGKVLRDDRLYEAAVAALEEARDAVAALGKVVDEDTAKSLKKTIGNIEEITAAIREGRGTVGQLVMDRQLINEAQRLIVELRESVEDVREQAPINAFIGAVFAAF